MKHSQTFRLPLIIIALLIAAGIYADSTAAEPVVKLSGEGSIDLSTGAAPSLQTTSLFQSSHASKDHDNGLYVENDYALSPINPRSTANRIMKAFWSVSICATVTSIASTITMSGRRPIGLC